MMRMAHDDDDTGERARSCVIPAGLPVPRCGDAVAQARLDPSELGDRPDRTEEWALLAGVSAAAAVAGQTRKHRAQRTPASVPWPYLVRAPMPARYILSLTRK